MARPRPARGDATRPRYLWLGKRDQYQAPAEILAGPSTARPDFEAARKKKFRKTENVSLARLSVKGWFGGFATLFFCVIAW